MDSLSISKQRAVALYDQGSWKSLADQLVTEERLQIVLNGQRLVSLACSPEYTRELAVGYLVSEGFISSYEELASIQVLHTLQIGIETTAPVDVSFPRQINTCMGRGSDLPMSPCLFPGVVSPWSPARLLQLIEELNTDSLTFKETGGIHSAALGGQNDILIRYEDIGRHNAVDKVIGHAFLQRIPLHDKCLLISGRIASKILLKSTRAGFPMIVSRSAPTFNAVERAEHLGVTVVGFARGQRFNLYCHGHRIANE